MPSGLALGFGLPLLVAQMSMPSAPPLPPLPIHIAITDATLAGLPRQSVAATDEHGASATYTGVALDDLLAAAHVPSGKNVRGKAMQLVVDVDASDGYRVAFSLAELDPSFVDRMVLIADRRDGAPLPAREGPYRLIVPGDKREARWARQVTAVDVEETP